MMTTTSDHKNSNETRGARLAGDESILPLSVRQRLWDQIWIRLLAAPVNAGDRAPTLKQGDRREGGQR